jgi:SHAQKYF class myb-like DNA-binding protein
MGMPIGMPGSMGMGMPGGMGMGMPGGMGMGMQGGMGIGMQGGMGMGAMQGGMMSLARREFIRVDDGGADSFFTAVRVNSYSQADGRTKRFVHDKPLPPFHSIHQPCRPTEKPFMKYDRKAKKAEPTAVSGTRGGRWTVQEHDQFLQALELHGNQINAKIVAAVPTRTIAQIRSHAQTHFARDGVLKVCALRSISEESCQAVRPVLCRSKASTFKCSGLETARTRASGSAL